MRAAVSHISSVLRWSGMFHSMYGLLCNKAVHISWMIYRNAFLNKSTILFKLLGMGKGQKMPWGGYSHNVQIYTSFFNHFHNPHFQGLAHCQDLSCSLYALPLKQAQENYQRYTLKDNLS